MKKKIRIFAILSALFALIAALYMLRKMYKERELRSLLEGISKLNREGLNLVSISYKTNRYLLRNTEDAMAAFNTFMEHKGWNKQQKYGRSLLYTKGHEEMLVKKTDLLNGYCVFEWMDENYVQNRVI